VLGSATNTLASDAEVAALIPAYVIAFTLVNNDTAIPTGVLNFKKSIPESGTITSVIISSIDGTTGNLTVDLLVDTLGVNPDAGDSICAGNVVTVTGDDFVQYTPSGWATTSVSNTQWITLEVEGTPTLTDATVEIIIQP